MKNIILYIVIAILFVIILFKQCHSSIPIEKKITNTIIKIDTVTIHDSVQGKTAFLTKKIHDTLWEDSVQYIPSTNYDRLLQQYDSLGDKYFSKYIYATPYKLGKYGSAVVTDTVVSNNIISSSLKYNLNFFDTVKEINTNIITPKRQLYIGGNLFFTDKDVNSLHGGLIYKDRKDHIYQANVGIDVNGNILYGVGLYYKIKL